jgi:hypothetical protein
LSLANTTLQDTWVGLITKINQAIISIQNTLTTGSTATGNVVLAGAFVANNIDVVNGISGGTIGAAANLNFTSNTIFANTGILTQFNSNTFYITTQVANATISAITTNINSNTLLISSNTTFSNSSYFSGNVTFSNTVSFTKAFTFSNTVSFGANVSFSNNTIDSVTLRSWKENVVFVPNANGTVNLDLSNTNIFRIELASNTTLTFSNYPANNILQSWTFHIKHLANNTSTTFPAAVKWDGGVMPPETITNYAIDVWSVWTIDGGSTGIGELVRKNVS